MVTFRIVQCHPGVTYIYNFWHSGTLALRAERQSAWMSEIINVGYTWIAKCNQLTPLPFKGLSQNSCHLCYEQWNSERSFSYSAVYVFVTEGLAYEWVVSVVCPGGITQCVQDVSWVILQFCIKWDKKLKGQNNGGMCINGSSSSSV